MYDNRKIHPINLGDRIKVQTIRGLKGNVIGRLPDGRAILFSRESPYINMLGPNQLVECNIIYVSQRYVIVDPRSEPEPFKVKEKPPGEPKPIEGEESLDLDGGELLEKLERLSYDGEWDTGIIARALIHIIGKFGTLRSMDHSSQNTDVVSEEPPIEQPSGSPESDGFLEAISSFGLTQTEVRESRAPESEFLRYLEEGERKDDETLSEEVRKDNGTLSTTIEDFGVIVDLPKDVTLLTIGQTRYLKEHHLKGIDGYDKIENFSNFFVEASALKRREYGNVFYASRGTNPWNKVHKITVQRDQG